ncbi:FabD/lysophospholipase-like protein [Hypoxylon rubiginosum]|uniref:FabD/lysophospholipase-like protein n=1 Tax=Hypoxylon rubiginosum TaxID=110542 RepID=A0ACC0DDR7_9PEZI|nr:FabD/lysophospholipase-like protein [Hypoxylon rubiginosum]
MTDPQSPQDQEPWLKKHLLAFDGGGVRGFYSLLFLQKLMQHIQLREESLGPIQQDDDPIKEHNTSRHVTSFSPCTEPPNVSHLEDGEYTPYLPCHYFDYITGTSTGGLIAIMLGRFRMTVEDCIHEYRSLAGDVFGHPRWLDDMHTLGLIKRSKYDTGTFERVIKNVIMRRVEGGRGNRQNARFDIEHGLCRVSVIANSFGSAGVTVPRIFRSYETKPSVESEMNPMGNLMAKSIGRPSDICVWQVARATTAAPMYFEPLELTIDDSFGHMIRNTRNQRRSTTQTNAFRNNTMSLSAPQVEKLQDGGFGPANNPSKEMLDELKLQLPDNMSVGIFVSIGTARPIEEPSGPRLLWTIKDGIARLGDPEPTHRHMQAAAQEKGFSYYRLNEPNGLHGMQMDSWKPRQTGENTMETMHNAFNAFCSQPKMESYIRRCAEELVAERRNRVAANMPKWKRFALGRHFYCRLGDCPDDDFRREVDEVKFVAHLREGHGLNDAQIRKALANCECQWIYRGK